MRKNRGFTLVEILIVVIILGILAAIVIPQFTNASDDARASSLASDLQTMRGQLELYKVQHLERYPNIDDAGNADASVANFKDRLTERTTQAGAIDPAGTLGPYLQAFPKNPYVDPTVQDVVVFGTAGTPEADAGWVFDTANGKLSPADADHAGW